MDDKVKDLVNTAMGKIKELSDADTIIGDPIKVDGDITIIPISKVSYGFAAGGSDLPSKTSTGLFGGGTGGGITIQPLAFIVVAHGDVKLLQLNQDKSSTGAIVNMIPEIFDKVQGMISKDKKKDTEQSVESKTEDDSVDIAVENASEFTGNFDF